MKLILIGGGSALLVGAALSWCNYLITKRMLDKHPNQVGISSVIRMAISVAYLIVLYFLAQFLQWPLEGLLVGGALGLTVPSVILAYRLSTKHSGKD